MESTSASSAPAATRVGVYTAVFALLAVLTAVEIGLTRLGLPKTATGAIFLALSASKASLVAAFFMHLRRDSRVYTYIFLLPLALVLIFAVLMVISSIGGHL